MKHRQVTQQGIHLIKTFEGFSPVVYLCSAGVKTVGYGHALRKGEDEKFKNGITKEEAIELLRQDIKEAERAVLRLIKVPLEDYQFDSLVSWTFNLGSASLQRSTLRSCLNRQEYHLVPNEIRKWVWAGGKKLKGLIRRREAEAILFQTGSLIL